MKKIFLLCLIFCSTLLFTGCVKTSCDIEINSNNEVSITKTEGVSIQNQVVPKGFYQVLERDMNKLAEKYSTEDNKLQTYINDYSAGVIYKKDSLTFEEATEFLPQGYVATNNKAIQVKEGLFKDTYTINMMYNPMVASQYVPEYYEEFKKSSETVEKFGNRLISFASTAVLVDNTPNCVLTIKIPTKAKKHNASMVISKNEYRWEFTDDRKPSEVNLEYDVYKFWPW